MYMQPAAMSNPKYADNFEEKTFWQWTNCWLEEKILLK